MSKKRYPYRPDDEPEYAPPGYDFEEYAEKREVSEYWYFERPDSGMRVPALAFYIIVLNLAFWLVLVPATTLIQTGNAVQVPAVVACSTAFVLLYLGIQYIVWRYFWWINALLMTVSTLLMMSLVCSVLANAPAFTVYLR